MTIENVLEEILDGYLSKEIAYIEVKTEAGDSFKMFPTRDIINKLDTIQDFLRDKNREDPTYPTSNFSYKLVRKNSDKPLGESILEATDRMK
jgi:hypothetical protein